jgi:hypothetical protein
VADYLVGLLARGGSGGDWNPEQSERWLAALIDAGSMTSAERFAAAGGPWSRAAALARLSVAYARRGERATALSRLDEARAARQHLLKDAPGFPVGNWTHGILAREGDTALLVRIWQAEKSLGLPEANDTWAEIIARPAAQEYSPHLFRAWLDANEPDRAADVAARQLRGRGFAPRELPELARTLDGAGLRRLIARLPSFEQDQHGFFDLVEANALGALARGDHQTVLDATFGHAEAMPRLSDPSAWIADEVVSEYLRRGDQAHARAVVERWRTKQGREPIRLYVAIARVAGVAEAERWGATAPVPKPLGKAAAHWLVDESEGSRTMRQPPLGQIAADAAALDALLAELRSVVEPLPAGPIAESRSTRAVVLARVIERQQGRANGWDDLVREAERGPSRNDRLAAIARGAAEAGDLDDAFALLSRVVADDRRLPEEQRPQRWWEVGRLAISYAERGRYTALVRALGLDDHILGVNPNSVDLALDALPGQRSNRMTGTPL